MAEQTAEEIAAAYYRRQQATTRQAAETAQAIWRTVDVDALDESWRSVGPLLVRTVAGGQRRAAAPADGYVTAVVVADGAATEPAGRLAVEAFAGRAADGRPLSSLLYEPWIETRWRLAAGQARPEAMRGGLATLVRQVGTEVPDAGRGAAGVSLAGNRATRGYVRVLNPPSCARCAVLAGIRYRYNAGFQRHPRCDCVHLPVTRYSKGRAASDPKEYFRSLSRAEQDRVFTQAGAQAIRDGADIGQIVNARRGMYTAEAYWQRLRSTYDATTKRGRFFRIERQRAIDRGLIPPSGRGFRLTTHRLLPEEIYKRAGSRDELIAMLRRYGYLI
ncbi:hypothetical protein P3T27_006504 [Kitasatospora sp. MAA19]|uniref:VG15 protein n=1 Tax=Kitasatospora sp. MAA19 TaxID=3035090 RepID=UPI002473743A|nr:hypothetical protein [Kitasatospora sp. MAA19]MDH6709755.1 hypothetical protein [Kitasatospora sp. MAA19]